MVHWWVLVHSGAVLRVTHILVDNARWQLYSVAALLKPTHLHLHQTSTNFKIPLHNRSHDVQPCPYTQQIKKERKGRWNKCRQAHMVSSQCNMGRGTKRPLLYHYQGDSFQCLQPDDLIEVHTKQKWKKLFRRLSMYVQSNLCMGSRNLGDQLTIIPSKSLEFEKPTH